LPTDYRIWSSAGNAPYSILPYSAGARVVAEGAGRIVGSVVATDDGLDYAVIKFDPAKVASVADFDGFAINGIGQAVRHRSPTSWTFAGRWIVEP
jgi:hypothetical protein